MDSSKSISEKDVLTFFKAAPSEVLRRLQGVLERQLSESEEIALRRQVMGARAQNQSRSDVWNDAPMPSSGKSSGKIVPPPSARSKLMAISKKYQSTVTTDAKTMEKQLAEVKTGDDGTFENYEVELTYMFSDRSGNGMFAIKNDPKLVSILEKLKTNCEKNSWYCPYGFGKTNDLLKVKNFKLSVPSTKVQVKLKISHWEYETRAGYSCYAQM